MHSTPLGGKGSESPPPIDHTSAVAAGYLSPAWASSSPEGQLSLAPPSVRCRCHTSPNPALIPRTAVPQGKNKPSRRQRKRQANIIEERKLWMQARMREQGTSAAGAGTGAGAARDGGACRRAPRR
jgi:hypothetical protein